MTAIGQLPDKKLHRPAMKIWLTVFFILGIGIGLRFYHITRDDFFLYDEGFYLNYNRVFLKMMEIVPPHNFSQFKEALLVWFRFSMASGKALWFLLTDARLFWGWIKVWCFPRLISAVAGTMTLGITFLLGKRFFNSNRVGIVSMALLAVLPSHVFYSRLGLQEAICTLFFTSGLYFYLFPRQFSAKTFLSGALLVCAYFTNYRLIIIPLLVAFTEIFISLSERRFPDIRKYVWHTVTFFFFVFIIGNLDKAENTIVTFSWMFHQANLAEGSFNWFNFLSYPYYLFRLESVVFGLLFFGNMYYLLRKQWIKLFPFAFVCLQMLIFSFVEDQAARYVAVTTPLMAIAVASIIVCIQQRNKFFEKIGWGIAVIAMVSLLGKSTTIARAQSDYKIAVQQLSVNDPHPLILSTQPWIQNLYTRNKMDVYECPHKLEGLVTLYAKGFRYLVLCPQVYISWTSTGEKFHLPLTGYLEFITTQVKPIGIFPHMNQVMLDRFVFEHNDNLRYSVQFLNAPNQHHGLIRIYSIKQIIETLGQWLSEQQKMKS